MPLFDLTRPPDDDEFIGSDAATRALSVTAVENDFVAAVYENSPRSTTSRLVQPFTPAASTPFGG